MGRCEELVGQAAQLAAAAVEIEGSSEVIGTFLRSFNSRREEGERKSKSCKDHRSIEGSGGNSFLLTVGKHRVIRSLHYEDTEPNRNSLDIVPQFPRSVDTRSWAQLRLRSWTCQYATKHIRGTLDSHLPSSFIS